VAHYVNNLGIVLLVLSPCLELWDGLPADARLLISLGLALTAGATLLLLAAEGSL